MEPVCLRNSVQNYYHLFLSITSLLDSSAFYPQHYMRAEATALRKEAQVQCFSRNAVVQRWHSAISTLVSSLTITPFFSLFILTSLHPHFSVLKSFSLDHLAKHSIFYCCDWKLKIATLGEQEKKKKAIGIKWAWNICLCHTIRDYSMNDRKVLKIHLTSQLDGSPSGQILDSWKIKNDMNRL